MSVNAKFLQIKNKFIWSAMAFLISMLMLAGGNRVSASGPYVWDNRSTVGVVPLRYAPEGTAMKTKFWMIEGRRFRMSCYTYNQWFSGNWNSNKWFYGQEQTYGYWGYVHSSYVFNQVSVGRC